jgi:uncharacterized protein
LLTLETARNWYPNTDPVHGFDHIERVYRMAERLALAEGADLEIVHAAALLHDIEGSHPAGDDRANHHFQSADIAAEILKNEGWSDERIAAVQHCIRAHRYRDDREPPATIEAKVLFDADKLDVLGAIGVARTIGYAVQAGQPIYTPPSAQFLATGMDQPGEPHSAYHEHLFKLSKVKDRLFTASAQKIAADRHAYLDAYFKRLIAEMDGSL